MTHPMAMLAGVMDEGGTRLVGADILRAPMGLLRAQVTSLATNLGPDGATWAQHLSDVPRYRGTARRLLVEGQRTNLIRNPRWEGATPGIIGSGGTVPTHMVWNMFAGFSVNILQIATINGLSCIDYELVATGAGFASKNIDGGMPFLPGTTYTTSLFCQIIGGSTANIDTMGVRQRVDTSNALNGTTVSMLSLGGAMTRVGVQMTTAADAATGRMQFMFVASGAASIQIRLAAPQLEIGAFASTPILPPVGTPGASTRGADLASASLASLGVTGACTVLWSGVVGQAAPSGADQALFQLDSGSDGSRVLAAVNGGTANIRTRNPAVTLTSDAGAMVPGAPFAVGVSLDGAGNASILRAGGTVQAITGVPTGLTTLRLGNNAAGTAPLFGEVKGLRVLPYAMQSGQMEAALANLG